MGCLSEEVAGGLWGSPTRAATLFHLVLHTPEHVGGTISLLLGLGTVHEPDEGRTPFPQLVLSLIFQRTAFKHRIADLVPWVGI